MFGLKDKVLAIIGGTGCALLAALLAYTIITKNAQIKALDQQINDPVTGLAIRLQNAQSDLALCRANRITMIEAVRRQNEAVAAAWAEGQKRIAALDEQLNKARRETTSAQAAASAILTTQPGDDLCAAADALILEAVR